MAETVKLTEEEIKQLNTAQQRSQALRLELADIGMLKLNIKSREQQAEAFHAKSIEFEKEVAKALEEKYGKGSVNLDTGTFIPQTE